MAIHLLMFVGGRERESKADFRWTLEVGRKTFDHFFHKKWLFKPFQVFSKWTKIQSFWPVLKLRAWQQWLLGLVAVEETNTVKRVG